MARRLAFVGSLTTLQAILPLILDSVFVLIYHTPFKKKAQSMASTAAQPDLELVSPIGDGLYLYEPPSAAPAGPDPALIIMNTWLGGATNRRLNKYIEGYHKRFPNSALLLLTTKLVDITVLPFSALHARLQPAREAIRQIAERHEVTRSVLLHVFSHGGSNTALQLMHSFRKDSDSDFDLSDRLYGIVFDCCPGDGDFGRAYKAATESLPSAWLPNTVGKILLVPFVGGVMFLQSLGLKSTLTDLRQELNSPEMFGTAPRRLYLYAEGDQVVQWQDVESHLEKAKTISDHPVTGIRFSDGAHCAIIRSHPEQYWRAIEDFWHAKDSQPRSRL